MLRKALNKATQNKKGFTLAELLIVVAIIGVLVAISIPIFNAQLEKSREAVDLANIRAAYAELTADYLQNDAAASKTVSITQKQENWQGANSGSVAGISVSGSISGNTSYVVTIDASGSVTVVTSK